MALKTLTLVLAATGIGMALYRMGQRPGAEVAPAPQSPAADPEPLGSSPNFGEKLQDMNLANAGMGSAANVDNEDLLASPRADEQQREDIKPGLPDFARGA